MKRIGVALVVALCAMGLFGVLGLGLDRLGVLGAPGGPRWEVYRFATMATGRPTVYPWVQWTFMSQIVIATLLFCVGGSLAYGGLGQVRRGRDTWWPTRPFC